MKLKNNNNQRKRVVEIFVAIYSEISLMYRVNSKYVTILKGQNLQTNCENHVHSVLRYTGVPKVPPFLEGTSFRDVVKC
jgi:hypothetical protein